MFSEYNVYALARDGFNNFAEDITGYIIDEIIERKFRCFNWISECNRRFNFKIYYEFQNVCLNGYYWNIFIFI